MVKITNRQLETYIAAAAAFEICICTAYSIVHQVYGGVEKTYLDDIQRTEWKCSQNVVVQYIDMANYMYILGLLGFLCIFSFKNRNSHKVFKESTCAFMGSFFGAVTFMVAVAFNGFVDRTEYTITIQSSLFLLALTFIWILFYGAHMYATCIVQ